MYNNVFLLLFTSSSQYSTRFSISHFWKSSDIESKNSFNQAFNSASELNETPHKAFERDRKFWNFVSTKSGECSGCDSNSQLCIWMASLAILAIWGRMLSSNKRTPFYRLSFFCLNSHVESHQMLFCNSVRAYHLLCHFPCRLIWSFVQKLALSFFIEFNLTAKRDTRHERLF